MTRGEFMEQLREALVGNVSQSVVQENMVYYSDYIAEEVRNGKSEEEVLDMLGDPWALAKTIIAASEGAEKTSYDSSAQRGRQTYYTGQSTSEQTSGYGSGGTSGGSAFPWWKKVLVIVAIIAVIAIIISIVMGIINLIAPIAIPVLIVLIVLRILENRRN